MKLLLIVIVSLQLLIACMLGVIIGGQAGEVVSYQEKFELAEARAQALERTRYGWVDSAYTCKKRVIVK